MNTITSTLGRFVIRGENEEINGCKYKDGLIIGSLFKNNNILKLNTVYEINECLGELTIREIGVSSMQTGQERKDIVNDKLENFPSPANWLYDINSILDQGHLKFALLNREEYKQYHINSLKEDKSNWAKEHKETCSYCNT